MSLPCKSFERQPFTLASSFRLFQRLHSASKFPAEGLLCLCTRARHQDAAVHIQHRCVHSNLAPRLLQARGRPWAASYWQAQPPLKNVRAAFERLHQRHNQSCQAHGAAAAASVMVAAAASQQAPMEARQYWESVLEGVDKPLAREMMAQLDLRYWLGIPQKTKIGQSKKAPLMPFFLSVKKEHPTKVLLVRVGEFYETMGTDAVLLMQWAGLNPMGQGNPPRAGCPVGNIRRTLQSLVQDANLSVVVCEEAPEPRSYGLRTKQKQRFVAGVVTPAQPHYLFGLLDANIDPVLGGTPPILAIAASAAGYKVMDVQLDMMTCNITDGLTEDAVSARLHQGGLAPPLYIHSSVQGSLQGRLSEGTVESEWQQRVVQIFRSQVGIVKRYNAKDAVDGLLMLLKRDLGLDAHTQFTCTAAKPGERPKPLYSSTASQLGLHKTKGIPNLLDYVLPRTAPQGPRRWLQRLLLIPPSPHTAAAVWRSCSFLSETRQPLPHWVVMDASNVTLKLKSQQATRAFFHDLAAMLSAVGDGCQDTVLRPLVEPLLKIAQAEMQFSLDIGKLQQTCRAGMQEIFSVVDSGSSLDRPDVSSSDVDGGLEVIARMLTVNEAFRGQIKPERMQRCITEVEEAGSRLEAELDRVLQAATAVWAQQASLPALKPTAVYDPVNNSIWLKAIHRSPVFKAAAELGLIHPRDRNGALRTDRFSTEALEAAQEAYRVACARANDEYREQLRQLSKRLTGMLPGLVCASMVSTIATALDAHVRQACERGWTHPQQLPRVLRDDAPRPAMQVEGMWPYWLDRRSPSTVLNSFTLDSMLLLTGPNMAGKSTVMRSTMAVALLAACGLFAPVASARVPYIDAFMLRTFSADAPIEGLSSFAIEMVEMRYVLEDAGPDALVLVDELGKGTEVRAGTSLAASFLEHLSALRCRGIFATHLHGLLDLRLAAPGLRKVKMGTRWEERGLPDADALDSLIQEQTHVGNGSAPAAAVHELGEKRLVPTWVMEDGECRDSLALEVAAQCKLPADIISRAAALYKEIEAPVSSRLSHAERSDDLSCSDEDAVLSSQSSDYDDTNLDGLQAQNRGPSIEAAADLLRMTAVTVLETVHSNGSLPLENGSTSEGAEQVANGEVRCGNGCREAMLSDDQHDIVTEYTVQVLGPGKVPPPSTVNRSCVYVVRRKDGFFYCGESDDIKGRLTRHRRAGPVKAGKTMEAAYMPIPTERAGKSAAAAVEARVIMALRDAGFPLISDHDASNRRTPQQNKLSA